MRCDQELAKVVLAGEGEVLRAPEVAVGLRGFEEARGQSICEAVVKVERTARPRNFHLGQVEVPVEVQEEQ